MQAAMYLDKRLYVIRVQKIFDQSKPRINLKRKGTMITVKWTRKQKTALTTVILGVLLLTLVACAPRQATVESSDSVGFEADDIITVPVWSEESNCESCHPVEVDSGADTATSHSVHVAQEDATCGTCHINADNTLALAHADYAYTESPNKLIKTSIPNDTCLSCHILDELKIATLSSTVLTDEHGLVINPHDLPVTDSHERNIECSTCHTIHSSHSLEENAEKACIACHHEKVYECGTCH
jgi:hypothetical protein